MWEKIRNHKYRAAAAVIAAALAGWLGGTQNGAETVKAIIEALF